MDLFFDDCPKNYIAGKDSILRGPGHMFHRVPDEDGHHRNVLLSDHEWGTELNGCSFVPIHSKANRARRIKPLLFAHDIDTDIAGQTHPGLLLTAQVDSLAGSELTEECSRGIALPCSHILPPDLLRQVRYDLKQLLLTRENIRLPRPRRRLPGSLELASGDLVMVEHKPYRGPARHLYFAVVSSDLWLHALETVASHSIAGILRPIIAMAPVIGDVPADEALLAASIAPVLKSFPNGAHCFYHRVRTYTYLRPISRVVALRQDDLDEIATGLSLYLGLQQ